MMKYRNKFVLFTFLFLLNGSSFSRTIDSLYEVGIWQGFRSGAVCFTFDDGCENQFKVAIPLFNEFGFKLTLNTVTSWTSNWNRLQTAADSGHEVASHTINHGHLGTLKEAALNTEYKSSQALINSRIKRHKCITLAYPYCETAIDSICEKYYIAARGCSGSLEPKTPSNFMNISSILCGSEGTVKTTAHFNSKANSAASTRGLVVFLLHGIDDDGGYSPVTTPDLRGTVEYLYNNKEKFWVNSFGNITRYIRERNCVSIEETFVSDTLITCEVTDTLDNTIYDYPVTIRRMLPQDWSTVLVSQNGKELISEIVEVDSVKYIMFDVVPDSGEVLLATTDITTGINDRINTKAMLPYLKQNYPNPFNPVTNIDYQITNAGFVTLKVHDLLGREVITLVNEEKSSGKYSVRFDGSNLPSGLYFYTLKTNNYSNTKKLVLLK